MKKILIFILALAMSLSLCACAGNPAESTGDSTSGTTSETTDTTGTTGTTKPDKTTETTGEPEEPPVKLNAAETLLDEFKRLVKANPDKGGLDIARLLCEHLYLTDMDLDVYMLKRPTSYDPFVIGMKEGFKVPDYVNMTDIVPQMQQIPFVAHIFELKEGTDAEEFANAFKENADLAFSEGTTATECESGFEGRFAFVVICTEDIVKDPSEVDTSSARYIMKKLTQTALKGLSMMTVDTDSERSSYYFGLKNSISLVEKVGAVCEPSMLGGSSVVIVKVKDAKDAKAVAEEMLVGLDTGKWICVQAEAKDTAYNGCYVIGVMGSGDFCKEVIDEFNAVVSNMK